MRYIKFTGGNGYGGWDFEEVQEFPDDTPDELFDEIASDMERDNGESYSHVATGWNEDFEDEVAEENYYNDCWSNWEEISAEEFHGEDE